MNGLKRRKMCTESSERKGKGVQTRLSRTKMFILRKNNWNKLCTQLVSSETITRRRERGGKRQTGKQAGRRMDGQRERKRDAIKESFYRPSIVGNVCTNYSWIAKWVQWPAARGKREATSIRRELNFDCINNFTWNGFMLQRTLHQNKLSTRSIVSIMEVGDSKNKPTNKHPSG